VIFAIKPFEIHDGDGIRTTVFFNGCPLRCKWCHNPECWVTEPRDLPSTAEEIAKEVLKDEIFMKGSGGGVTFSGGEPLLQVDFCVDIAKIIKSREVNLAVDTCGAVSRSAIDKILPYTDTFLYDIKAIDENVHIACTGYSNQQILENLLYIDSVGKPVEIRYPYVPTMNDGEVEKIAKFVRELHSVKCVRILGYHNYAEDKYQRL
jgi:pyruvate formate lyase activating enzyme